MEQTQKDEIRELRDDNEVLRQQRSQLVNGSEDAQSSAEQTEKGYQEERVRLVLDCKVGGPVADQVDGV